MELTNENLLCRMVKARCASTPQLEETSSPPSLTAVEENIIRYVAGFVGMKLQNRYLSQDGEKAAEFVECLEYMSVQGRESSCIDYTREWIDKVNRGGLFCVSDEAYNLVVSIEISIQCALTKHLKSSHTLTMTESKSRKEGIIDAAVKNEDVLSYFSTFAVDISSNQDGLELLHNIVEMWLTIHGYAITKAWMEEYKSLNQTTTKKRSHRKELKKASKPNPTD